MLVLFSFVNMFLGSMFMYRVLADGNDFVSEQGWIYPNSDSFQVLYLSHLMLITLMLLTICILNILTRIRTTITRFLL